MRANVMADEKKKLLKHLKTDKLDVYENSFLFKRCWSIAFNTYDYAQKKKVKLSSAPQQEPNSEYSYANMKTYIRKVKPIIDAKRAKKTEKREKKKDKEKEKKQKEKEREKRKKEKETKEKLKALNAKRKADGKKPLKHLPKK
ncbi:MAG: hypothetical protein CMM93_07060 [Rickettsiales bacterium]|nr:hypothetical protein [Rickettsiales bacterium]